MFIEIEEVVQGLSCINISNIIDFNSATIIDDKGERVEGCIIVTKKNNYRIKESYEDFISRIDASGPRITYRSPVDLNHGREDKDIQCKDSRNEGFRYPF